MCWPVSWKTVMRLIDLLANMRIELHYLTEIEDRNELRSLTGNHLMRQLQYALLMTGRWHETR